ncbi:MAG: hypothetical protein Q8933_08340 [Bacteroidota bacterium]|nr:hypothetical protein [Bacteroidota bacterium]MDP4195010.1 hypothetical protein [Bacteroidota bacterium]
MLKLKERLKVMVFLVLFTLTSCSDDFDELQIINKPISFIDKNTIVYQSAEGHLGWRIKLLSSDLTQSYMITSGPADFVPEWSPDKKWIVFSRMFNPNNVSRIWKMRYDGEEKKALTPIDKDCNDPKISPDGKTIIFNVVINNRKQICAIDTNGNNWRQLTNDSLNPFKDRTIFAWADFSPDGKRIILTYYKAGTDQEGLGILNIETNELTHISQADQYSPYSARWSPVRDEVVFVGTIPNGTGPKLFRMNIDGSDIKMLTDAWGSFAPDWSSDGSMIAYTSTNGLDDYTRIWTMNRDGSNKKLVIEIKEAHVTDPSW